jgi:hypothetical protein
MARFLTILHGTDADVDRVEPNAQQQREFMNAWAAWAHDHGEALVDPGSPRFRKKRLTAKGDEDLRLEDYEDSAVAYAIVEADTHDEAVQIVSEHPHLRLAVGNSIEVIECPPISE